MAELTVGMTGSVEMVVEERFTAAHLGSGAVNVLATPMMIAFMEEASRRAVEPHLPATQKTVGTMVCIKHLAATPQGMKFRTEAELIEIDRRRLKFKVAAYDEQEKIGEGEHERFIIDVAQRAVADLMTRHVVTTEPEMPVLRAASLMPVHRVRRLPVIAAGRLVGIVSLGDVHQGIFRKHFGEDK